MRRRPGVIAALLGFCVFALLAWSLFPTSPVTKANFDAIELGSTRAEIEALLGPPAGPEELREAKAALFLAVLTAVENGDGDTGLGPRAVKGHSLQSAYRLSWVGQGQVIEAEFDTADRVTGLRLYSFRRPSFFSKIRDGIRNQIGF